MNPTTTPAVEARCLGANGVVGIDFDEVVGQSRLMVTASGTAVNLETKA